MHHIILKKVFNMCEPQSHAHKKILKTAGLKLYHIVHATLITLFVVFNMPFP